MIGPLDSYQDIYVAACGKVCGSQREGRFHERICAYCRQEMGETKPEREDEPKPKPVVTTETKEESD